MNDALEDHSVGGISWHSIMSYPDIPEDVIALIDPPMSAASVTQPLEQIDNDDNGDDGDVDNEDDDDDDDEDEDDSDDGDDDDDSMPLVSLPFL